MAKPLTKSEFEDIKDKFRPWLKDNPDALIVRLIVTLNAVWGRYESLVTESKK